MLDKLLLIFFFIYLGVIYYMINKKSTPIQFHNREKNQKRFLEDPQNKLYRLGDVIRGYFDNDLELYNFYLKKYPNSIATSYIKKKFLLDNYHYYDTVYRPDYRLLSKIIDKKLVKYILMYKNINWFIPDKFTLVIHVRTGDIIDKTSFSVEDILSGKYKKSGITKKNYYDKKCHNYVRSISYYYSLLSKYKFDSVVLVTGFHTKENHTKSIKYILGIKKIIGILVRNVHMRINNNPDYDFVYMCNSNYFNPSGGGYSNLISKMVKIKNGLVIV